MTNNKKRFFHTTKANFEFFDVKFSGDEMGIHFGSEEQALDLSKKFLEENPDDIFMYEVELDLKNTLRLEDFGVWRGFQLTLAIKELTGVKLNNDLDSHQIRKKLLKMGYDSVVYENDFEYEGDSFIILDPQKQVNIIDKKVILTGDIKNFLNQKSNNPTTPTISKSSSNLNI